MAFYLLSEDQRRRFSQLPDRAVFDARFAELMAARMGNTDASTPPEQLREIMAAVIDEILDELSDGEP